MSSDDTATQDTTGRDSAEIAQFVERLASDLVSAGMPRMPSRVFAALLTSDDGRLTAAELAELLAISPAAVSGAVRYLLQVNMASRESVPGSRRDHYRAHNELWQETLSRDGVLGRLESSLAAGVTALGPDSPAGNRIADTRDFISYIRGEMPKLVDRWRESRGQQPR
jgi:predicted transcriptional regulator